jgi:hypothetical protein
MTNKNDKLICFFRQLADNIELNQISNEQLMKAGEIYMDYQYADHTSLFGSGSEKEIQKYLFTGWYIYLMLEFNKIENNQEDGTEESQENAIH